MGGDGKEGKRKGGREGRKRKVVRCNVWVMLWAWGRRGREREREREREVDIVQPCTL